MSTTGLVSFLNRSVALGSVFGIRLIARYSFLILLGIIGLPLILGAGSSPLGLIGAVAIVALTVGSIIAHELGHSLTAIHYGMAVPQIELHVFGGVARAVGSFSSPRQERWIALAGPAVSLGLAAAFLVLAQATGWLVFKIPALMNLAFGVFNLLPALPMDGGRVLRAHLTLRHGFFTATQKAVAVARVVAVLLGCVGLLSMQLYLVALAAYLWYLGTQELENARMMKQAEPLRAVTNAARAPYTQVSVTRR
jgi:Zn-dependent protease